MREIEAVILIALLPLNAYFVWHGYMIQARYPSPLLQSLWVVKVAIAVLTLVIAIAAFISLVSPPAREVTWVGLAFGAGLILFELLPAYIHVQMIRLRGD